MTYELKRDRDNDAKTLDELCQALSAKVMPARPVYSMGGVEMEEIDAQKAQRRGWT